MKPRLCRRIGQAHQFVARALLLGVHACSLFGGAFNRAHQLGVARLQAAKGKAGFLGLALQRALLLTRVGQGALRLNDLLFELRVALLLLGQFQVERFKLSLGGEAALIELVDLALNFEHLV